jgi:hypothetical protein
MKSKCAQAIANSPNLIVLSFDRILSGKEEIMSAAETTERIAEASPRSKARITTVFYLLTVLTGVFILWFGGSLGVIADIAGTAFYIAVIALFYALSKAA